MHPDLRRRIRVVYQQEASCAKRAEELLSATESAWSILGYSRTREPPTERQVMRLASIAAGLLKAEGTPGLRSEMVRLWLIPTAGVLPSGNVDEQEAPESSGEG